MRQSFFSLKTALGVGLLWSLAFYLVLMWVPREFAGHQNIGRWALASTSAVLTLVSALRQNRWWPHLLYAWIILFILASAKLGPGAGTLAAAAVAASFRAGACSTAAELASAAGTIGLAIWFRPTGSAVIALGIWLFYLLQVGPLLVCDTGSRSFGAGASRRRFEDTRRRVERLLAVRI